MHFWILQHYATGPSSPSGSRHYDLATALVRHGHQATIFAASWNHYAEQMHPAFVADPSLTVHQEDCEGVTFVRLRTTPYTGNGLGRLSNMLEFTKRVSSIAQQWPHKPDIIIGSTVHPFAAWAARRLAGHFNCPWIFEIRDLWPQSIVDLGVAPAWHPFVLFLGWLERSLLRTADHIIAVWPGMIDYCMQRGVPRHLITSLPHAVDLRRLPAEWNYPSETGPVRLTYFGSHRKNNALEPIIKAVALAQAARPGKLAVTFIGEGDAKATLQSLAVSVQAHIDFRPGVAKDRLTSALQSSHGFVINTHPSPLYQKYELSINKLYDAMGMGRPVILAATTPRDPITIAKAGWTVPSNDVDGLTKAMIELVDSPHEARAAMGQKARDYVVTHHDNDRLAMNLVNIARSLVTPAVVQPYRPPRWENVHNTRIRTATIQDATALASLHHRTLQSAFLSTLGLPFLTSLYQAWLTDPSAVVVLAETTTRDEIIGIAVGTASPRRTLRHFILSEWRTITRTLLPRLNGDMIWRCLETLLQAGSAKSSVHRPLPELLVFGVDPSRRRHGIATALFEELVHKLKTEQGITSFAAIVGSALPAAAPFYEKMGGIRLGTVTVHAHTPPSHVYSFSCHSERTSL